MVGKDGRMEGWINGGRENRRERGMERGRKRRKFEVGRCRGGRGTGRRLSCRNAYDQNTFYDILN